ncbi:MAG: restriction endonuclease [Bacteroidales bacterium]|nr:restriction endonuclease [Bacteroidales bacterium]
MTYHKYSTNNHSVTSYERNQQAREKCLSYFGYSCQICGINFEKVYGEIGKGFIHVHHVDFISSFDGAAHEINPCEEQIPVCPNCHASSIGS